MTPEQKEAARRAEIMLAFSRGEAIERCISKDGDWERTIIPNWNWVDFDYRVARVPIELRVALAYDPTGGLINSRVVGFLNADEKAMGRPVGVVIDKQGDLLVADDVGNKIWRVSGK